jgi:RNA polymerase sigma factor (sigma-70 family)
VLRASAEEVFHPDTAETELIERCRASDEDAWDALFDRYYAAVARFVFQLSADFSHEDREEICQETFLSVVRNLESFHGKSSFQTWLFRIATNKAMDFRQKMHAAKRGAEAAVLVPADEWRRLQAAARPSLKELLLSNQARTEALTPFRRRARRRAPTAFR